MRKAILLIMIFSFILCSCSTNKPISSESCNSISTSSDIMSAVSNKSTISTVSKSVSTVSSASVLNFYEIPTDNGDEIFYSTAVKIGDRIYAGSKNKVISFNEDLSDIQVLYEYPDQKFFVRSILQIDENTIYVCFSEDVLSFMTIYKYQLIDICDKSAQPYKNEDFILYPFKRFNDIYYFKESPVANCCDLFELNLYRNDCILLNSIGDILLFQKGVFLVDEPEPFNKDNNISIIYYFDFEAHEMRMVMEISGLGGIKISGNYVLYTVYPHDKVYVYDIVHKTTINLTKKLGIEFDVYSADVKNEHIFVYDKVKGYEQYDILDINMADLTITEADKTNLPGYIGEWRYYNLRPHTLGNEDVTEEDSFTLQRSTWDGVVQFVY